MSALTGARASSSELWSSDSVIGLYRIMSQKEAVMGNISASPKRQVAIFVVSMVGRVVVGRTV